MVVGDSVGILIVEYALVVVVVGNNVVGASVLVFELVEVLGISVVVLALVGFAVGIQK